VSERFSFVATFTRDDRADLVSQKQGETHTCWQAELNYYSTVHIQNGLMTCNSSISTFCFKWFIYRY